MCVPPPPVLPMQPDRLAHRASAKVAAARRATLGGHCPAWRLATATHHNSRHPKTMGYRYRRWPSGDGPLGRGDRVAVAACVKTVTLTLTAADPFIATEVWLTEQVALAGAPLQLRVTDWLKPPCGETCNWKPADCPGATLLEPDPFGAI